MKDSLQISYPYYVNVTAFDFGSPASGLPSLETPITTGAVVAYAWDNADSVAAKDLKVYVYPNPYRSDGGYLEHGYETAVQNRKDLSRRVHFANVPPKCKIRIFTLDGDLVKEINHDMSAADPAATHAEWDLVTRNTQAVVSGLYYWTVESTDGNIQIGKLVVIL